MKLVCCDKMTYALKHAIVRTHPVRFGLDVLDPPLNEIRFCPWCGSRTVIWGKEDNDEIAKAKDQTP